MQEQRRSADARMARATQPAVVPASMLLALLAVAHVAGAQDTHDAEIFKNFYGGFIDYRETGYMSPEFKDMVGEMSFKNMMRSEQRLGLCTVCNAAVKTILTLYHNGASENDIKNAMTELCVVLQVDTRRVCSGVIDLNVGIFTYIIDHNPTLKAEHVCAQVLQSSSCNPLYQAEWTVNATLGEKPKTIPHVPKENGETLTIVQLTDIHTDPKYQAGGNANCREPTCCRNNQGPPNNPSDAAGFWGDYRNCDLPWHTVVNALEHIKDQHENIDYIYMTGDLVDHGVWETSRERNKEIFTNFYTELKDVFGATPMFPALGNHEPHPLNVCRFGAYLVPWRILPANINCKLMADTTIFFTALQLTTAINSLQGARCTPNLHLEKKFKSKFILSTLCASLYAPPEVVEEEFSTKWLYEATVQYWSPWLPAGVSDTILRGGFYTALMRPGLRVISLNNNICYIYNWWLLLQPEDPSNQLQWLVETLLQAEKQGEIVHILAHIPPGTSECQNAWSREFRKIINRFENTVRAHFNGHTHNDEFHIFYSLEEPTRANNIAFNGASLTTYSNLNPNYKVYTIDTATGLVLDIQTWIYNLTEANENLRKYPLWYQEYSFKETYRTKSLVPTELDDLAYRMTEDHRLIENYATYFTKSSPAVPECDTECLRNKLCSIVTAHAPDRTQCDKVLAEFDKQTIIQKL